MCVNFFFLKLSIPSVNAALMVHRVNIIVKVLSRLFEKLVLTRKLEYPKSERLEMFRVKCFRKIAIFKVHGMSKAL